MTQVALDWNATRVLGLAGPAGDYPLPLALSPQVHEIPMQISLERGSPQVGQAGRECSRVAPHLVCECFLHHLGPSGSATWKLGSRPFTPDHAVAAVWETLRPACRNASGVLLVLPDYVTAAQADVIRQAGQYRSVPVLGSIPAALAAALAARNEQFWLRSVFVLDCDEHAMTLSLVVANGPNAERAHVRIAPALSGREWCDRLSNAISDLSILEMRRDPRDSPATEQSLYEQLDLLLDAWRQQHAMQFALQWPGKPQHLLIKPAQTERMVSRLVKQTVEEIQRMLEAHPQAEPPAGIVLTHGAGRWPGLADACRMLVQSWFDSADTPEPGGRRTKLDDFGAELVAECDEAPAEVEVLAPEAPARAAHALIEAMCTGALDRGPIDRRVLLPAPTAPDLGPARLSFRGQDYLLATVHFVLGAHADCQLRFDRERYPTVAEFHCEIRADRRGFVLLNHCQEGTLVNDQPAAGVVALTAGDWIRLGRVGPTLRFLGHPTPPAPATAPARPFRLG